MSKCINAKIEIDGVGFKYSGQGWMNGIVAIASADTPVLMLTDADNSTLYEVKSALTGQRYFSMQFAKPQYFKDIRCDIFTNMERVIIYLDHV